MLLLEFVMWVCVILLGAYFIGFMIGEFDNKDES